VGPIDCHYMTDRLQRFELKPSRLAFSFGTRRRQSLDFTLPSFPFFFFFSCLLLLSRLTSSIEETLSARLSKLENYGSSSQREVWVLGNLFVLTGRSRPDIRGMRGRGGKSCVWRLFPLRTLRISIYIYLKLYFS